MSAIPAGSNSPVAQSLQEIASLLLLVHDYYLQGCHGSEVLVPLTVLIKDVGLSDAVSFLDIERLRRTVMGTSEGGMGYERFYDWLRGIAQLVYRGDDGSGRRELHLLITKHILPFASALHKSAAEQGDAVGNQARPSPARESYSFSMPFFTEAEMAFIVKYTDFLLYWYHYLATQVS